MQCIFSCVLHLYSYPKQVSHFWKIGLVIICCGFILVLTPNNWAELLRKLVRCCTTWNYSAGLMETLHSFFWSAESSIKTGLAFRKSKKVWKFQLVIFFHLQVGKEKQVPHIWRRSKSTWFANRFYLLFPSERDFFLYSGLISQYNNMLYFFSGYIGSRLRSPSGRVR